VLIEQQVTHSVAGSLVHAMLTLDIVFTTLQAAGGLVNCDHEDGCANKFHWYCGWKAGAHLITEVRHRITMCICPAM
jgi:hypothetical protein